MPEDDPVRERMEHAARRARTLGTVWVVVALLFVGGSLGTIAYTAWKVKELTEADVARREASRRQAEFGRDLARCSLQELGELRAAAEAHYEAMAQVHAQRTRDTRPSLDEEAPEVTEKLERACVKVIEQLRNGEGD